MQKMIEIEQMSRTILQFFLQSSAQQVNDEEVRVIDDEASTRTLFRQSLLVMQKMIQIEHKTRTMLQFFANSYLTGE